MPSIKLHPTSPNKCDVTKQGGQTSQTFHQTFALQMLGEVFDRFDRGFTHQAARNILIKYNYIFP